MSDSDEIICAICLDNCSEMNNNAMIWWCEHIFHIECINKFMEYENNMKCPMCRNDIKNIVDMSDKMDMYIYKSIKDENNYNYANGILNEVDKEKVDLFVNDYFLMEYIDKEMLNESVGLECDMEMRMMEEMMCMDYGLVDFVE